MHRCVVLWVHNGEMKVRSLFAFFLPLFSSNLISLAFLSLCSFSGKGKLADILAADYDVVARFNGGSNAGHTIVANGRKFAFHMLPCGLVHEHTECVLGNGCVVDFDSLAREGAALSDAGIEWQSRLKIGDRAHIIFDAHRDMDARMEEARGGAGIGTTRKGIGPAYTAKAQRTGIRVGELRDFDGFARAVREMAALHNALYSDGTVDADAELERFAEHARQFRSSIVDSVYSVNAALADGKRVLAEGANAAMLDLDFGTWPYVTSSTTTAGGLCTGLGLAPAKIECTLGVVKAYTTRVGWGPFPTELTSTEQGGMLDVGAPGTDIGRHLQEVGGEIGVTTGRKRRCGWLDVPVIQYSALVNGFSSINLTKLDVLDDVAEIQIGVAYRLGDTVLKPGQMPSTLDALERVQIDYETMPGWQQSIAECRTYDALPVEAQRYIERIEQLVGVPISWIGVGPGREAIINKQ
jgi:adenylosuccinate synthase